MAIQADPNFAIAKGTLGLLLIQFLDDKESGQQWLREALIDGEVLPQREYLMIRAVNRQFVDEDPEGALEEYELICELFPDDMPAYNNRGRILMSQGRYDEAAAMFEKATELDSRSGVALQNLWFLHVLHQRRARASEVVARRSLGTWARRAGISRGLGLESGGPGSIHRSRRPPFDTPWRSNPITITPYRTWAWFCSVWERRMRRRRSCDGFTNWPRPGRFPATGRPPPLTLPWPWLPPATPARPRSSCWRSPNACAPGAGAASLSTNDYLVLARLAAAVGRSDEARRWIRHAEAFGVESANDRIALAAALAMVGDEDTALDELETAYEGYVWDPYHSLVMTSFNGLLDEPRFLALFGIEEIS